MKPPTRLIPLFLGLVLATLAGCAKPKTEAARDISAEAQAYYQAHPDFFITATAADIPKDLKWEDGSDVPEFADPAAKRGGTLHFWIDDFPRTLRFAGPDANGSFRSFILDDVTLTLLQKQPNTAQYFPGLATAWALGADGRTMYFKLDPDARYSDGEPVKISDYFFTFFFFRSSYINDPWSNNFITSISARSRNTTTTPSPSPGRKRSPTSTTGWDQPRLFRNISTRNSALILPNATNGGSSRPPVPTRFSLRTSTRAVPST